MKISLWTRTQIQLLPINLWGFSRETTSHCKCVRYKALFLLITVTDPPCYLSALRQQVLSVINGFKGKQSTNSNPSSDSSGGIRLEYEE